MAAKTLDIQGAKSANITVVEDSERGRQAVHDVVVLATVLFQIRSYSLSSSERNTEARSLGEAKVSPAGRTAS